MSPVVATFLGWAALEQELTTPQLAGAGLVDIAVAMPQITNRVRPIPTTQPSLAT